MNVTILGGCGFIGSHLADAFLEQNHTITIFDHLNVNRRNIEHLGDRVRFLGGDFYKTSDIANAINDAEAVIHLVSSTLPGTSMKNIAYDVETNVIGSINLFEQCVKANVRKVVFISSGGTVYGIPRKLPIPENHPLDPISPYGISKLAIEKYLGLFNHHYGLDYVVLRLSNPYGVRQDPSTGQGVVATWMNQIKNNEAVEIWGEGDVVRDYLYIKDAVQAVALATYKNTEHKILNVGSGEGHSLLDLHVKLEECVGKSVPIQFRPIRKVDVQENVLDISLIKKVLDWKPKASIEEGLSTTWQSFS